MKVQQILLGLIALIVACLALNDVGVSVTVGRAEQLDCSCNDTPCPENNFSCVNGQCQCVHHTGCNVSSDCDHAINCPGGDVVTCEKDVNWSDGVCLCIPDPVACDCSRLACDEGFAACDVNNDCQCFPVVGCKPDAQGKMVDVIDCKQALTHCSPGKFPTCNEESSYERGLCYCKDA